jgi:uncharacterized protein (DUF2141 family)
MIQRCIIIILFVLSSPTLSKGQLKLTIEVSELRNSIGQVHLELSNSDEVQVKGVTKSIIDNKCVIVIDNLKPGKYAFKFFHDENKNSKLDVNWIGIPKEGFGFSNNPAMKFGPPPFEKTIFELNQSLVLKCKPVYF